VDVEVDLYSGRPNPRFRLSAEAADELLRRINVLPAAAEAVPPVERLGYRGLRVHAGTSSSPSEVMISGGTVTVGNAAGEVRQLVDRDRGLERWLIDAGSGELDADLVTMLRKEVGR
jgi:hypothetical protein